MVNALLCRVHQSGHLAKINPHSRAQVQSGIRIYKEAIRQHLPAAIPFFPLGVPSIVDEESPVALGMRSPDKTFLAVWRLNGPATVQVTAEQVAQGKLLYPVDLGVLVEQSGTRLAVTFPRKHMAAIIEASERAR
jgi:alpha-galactosidase